MMWPGHRSECCSEHQDVPGGAGFSPAWRVQKVIPTAKREEHGQKSHTILFHLLTASKGAESRAGNNRWA